MNNKNSIKKTGFTLKQAVIVIAVTLAVIILFDIFTGLVLIDFSISKKSGKEFMSEPNYSVTEEVSAAINKNTAILSELTEKWLSEANIEQAEITANDGITLKGDLIAAQSSEDGSEGRDNKHLWVILLHGYWRNRSRTYNFARFYAEKGFSMILPDMRGHGESGGEYVGMGWLDRLDILKWTELIISRDPDAEIILHGISMGAAAAMMTAGEKLPENVKAVVEDCGYTGVWEEFGNVMRDRTGISEFPLLHTCNILAGIMAGYTFTEASSLEQLKKAEVPVLFIHGSNDTFVRTEMVYTLYDACSAEKDIYIAEGAPHGQSLYLDPESYFDKVFSFIERYL